MTKLGKKLIAAAQEAVAIARNEADPADYRVHVRETVLDLLWGCTAIAEAIGRTRRATFHMLEKGQLPAKRVGGRWVASRAALAEFFGHLDPDKKTS